MKIAITAGYNSSKHAIGLIHGLTDIGIPIQSCLIVKTFSWKRFKTYYKKLDKKELMKKVKDRLFYNYIPKDQISDEIKYINDYFKMHFIQYEKVNDICKSNGIKSKFVRNLNSLEAINHVKEHDLLIYAGGGILREKLINRMKLGVLNCHSSQLPKLRGMNATEWSILMNVPTANTMHFINKKVDQGPIIKVINHDYYDCKSINQIRGRAIINTIDDLIQTTQDIVDGNYTTKRQNPEDGKQYYTMHPILKDLVNQKLVNNLV